MPTQSDASGDDDAMSLTSAALRSLGEPSELWLVHRLDRVVGGLIVFARNKRCAALLSELVGGNGMDKEYLAVADGFVGDEGELVDYIFKDSAKGKAFVVDSARRGAKDAKLEYTLLACSEGERGAKSLLRVKLQTGRFHQIRVQFASRKAPLTGDGKYGSRDNRSKMPALFAFRLAFDINGKKTDVRILPDTREYPWCLFEKEVYI